MVALVEDVLHCIIQFCPPSTISAVSRVSLSLRMLALPYLLRTVCLDKSPKQIVDFSNFVIQNSSELAAETFGPGGYVFELELHEIFAFRTHIQHLEGYVAAEEEPYPISTWAPLLTRALKLMHNLRSFFLVGNTDYITTHAPDFGQAVASLSKLASLILFGVRKETLHAFGRVMVPSTTSSSLLSLELHGDDFANRMDTLNADGGVRQILSKFNVDSLTNLCLDFFDLTSCLEKDPLVFLCTRNLKLGDYNTSLKALAAAFPAVQRLDLGLSRFSYQYFSEDSVSFPNLVSIRWTYEDILLFLKCNASRGSVRRVVMSLICDGDDGDDTSSFALPRIAPQLESVCFRKHGNKPLEWWTSFQHFVNLRYLEVAVDAKWESDWDFICNSIPATLSSNPLAYLSITIDEYGDVTTNPAFSEKSIALAFSNAIPSLKYIEVSKEHWICDPHNPTVEQRFWWEVIRRNNSAVFEMKPVAEEEGIRLRDYYDMKATSASNKIY